MKSPSGIHQKRIDRKLLEFSRLLFSTLSTIYRHSIIIKKTWDSPSKKGGKDQDPITQMIHKRSTALETG